MKSLRLVMPFVVALVLVVALFAGAKIGWSDFTGAVRGFTLPILAGILATTGLFLLLSNLKWRLVMARISHPEAAPIDWRLSLYYTALGAALSVVFLPQAAMAVSRALGARYHLQQPATTSAAATVFEQIFDQIPLFAFAAATVAVIVMGAGIGQWLFLSAALIAAGYVALVVMLRTGFKLPGRFGIVPAALRSRYESKFAWFGGDAAQSLLQSRFIAILCGLSIARYFALLLRALLIFRALETPITGFAFFKAFSLVRLSGLLAITPGGLGVTEWTWTGVLVWMNYSLEEATRFAIANRFYNVTSVLAVFALVSMALWLGGLLGRDAGGPRERSKP